MRKILKNTSKKHIILMAVVGVSLVLFTALFISSNIIKRAQADQRAAQRWAAEGGYAQISCLFADGEKISFDTIMELRGQIDKGLSDVSYLTEDGGGRSYIDAYSGSGKIQIISERTSMDSPAFGVGGDFFHFHPLTLVSGTYFSGAELNKDAIIIDEEAAWQLFGASDVTGMEVTIGGVPHYVRGVVSREGGRLWDASGLGGGMVYLSLESLTAYGETAGIHYYEAVMPNPVQGFAYRLAAENFGYTEDKMVVIDNTARFDIMALVTVISELGTRSMQLYSLRFPYWENYARGIEDILAFMLILKALLLLGVALIIIVSLHNAYRHRSWTWPGLLKGAAKKVKAGMDKRRAAWKG